MQNIVILVTLGSTTLLSPFLYYIPHSIVFYFDYYFNLLWFSEPFNFVQFIDYWTILFELFCNLWSYSTSF